MFKVVMSGRRLDGLVNLTGDFLTVYDAADFKADVTIAGSLTLDSSIVSGGTSSDSLVVAGLTGTTFTVQSTQDSTLVTTGAANFLGGISVAKNICTAANLLTGNNVVVGNEVLLKNNIISSDGSDLFLRANPGSIILQPNSDYSHAVLVAPSLFAVTNASGVIQATIIDGKITCTSDIVHGGFTFFLGTTDQVTRGDSGASRAMAKISGNVLCLNFDSDYTGGTLVDSNLQVSGTVTAPGLVIKNTSITSNNNDVFINANNDWINLRPKGSNQNSLIVTPTTVLVTDVTGANKTIISNGGDIAAISFTATGTVTGLVVSGQGFNLKNASFTSNNNDVFINANNDWINLRPKGSSLNSLIVTPSVVLVTDAAGVNKTIISNGGDIAAISLTTTGNVTAPQFIGGVSGTFVPVIPSDTTITYTTQTGFYYKMGNMVHVDIRIATTGALAIGSAVALAIDNFPFVNSSTAAVNGTATFENYPFFPSTDIVTPYIAPGVAYCNFACSRDNLQIGLAVLPTDAATRILTVSFTYYTA